MERRHFEKSLSVDSMFPGLCTALWPLYYMSKLVGLAPFTIKCRLSIPYLNFGIQTYLWTSVICITLMIGCVGCFTWASLNDYPNYKASVIVTDAASVLLQFASSLTALFTILASTKNKIESILLKLSAVNISSLTVDSSELLRKTGKYTLINACVLVLIYSILYFLAYYSFGANYGWITIVPKHIATSVNVVVVFQFTTFTSLLRRMFRILNLYLERIQETSYTVAQSNSHQQKDNHLIGQWVNPGMGEILPSVNPCENPSTSPNYNKVTEISYFSEEHIRKARKLHSQLHEIAEILGSIYGFPLLVNLTSDFMSAVSSFHIPLGLMVTGIRAEGKQRNFLIMLAGIIMCWAVVYYLKLLVVAWCAQVAADEANTTLGLVHRIMLKNDIPDKSVAELKDFAFQLMNNKVEFSASGFFNINYSFLYGIFGATTTYLVILLQFG